MLYTDVAAAQETIKVVARSSWRPEALQERHRSPGLPQFYVGVRPSITGVETYIEARPINHGSRRVGASSARRDCKATNKTQSKQ